MRARVSVLTIVFVLMGCKLELRERPGPPALPLDGIWLRQDTFADPRLPTRVLLEIRQQAKGGGYDFKLFTVAHRDLLVSGKTCIYTDIKGQLLTSPREVLLRREGLRSGFIPNTSKAPGPIWPMDAYETEILDREIARAVDI
ncbi:MAG: hypothetical protein HY042_13060, partial [Spirochaetia bacterium]|nr:hypothetical protein [Spirochaetia bacterium]